MSPWTVWETQERQATDSALRELPPEQELLALRERVRELERRVAEKSLEADALRETGQAIGSMSKLGDMLKSVADIVVRVTGTDLCLIYLMDEGGNELVLRGVSGTTKQVVGKIRLKLGEGVTGWVAQQGTHVVINREAWTDQRFKPIPTLLQDKYHSMLSVPLRGRKELVGVVNVRTNSPNEYSDVQVKLLDSIARQVGGAVENSNLYKRMAKRASQLSTISEISRTITSDLYLEEVLELIVAMTAESMNFKICSIMMLDENRDELVIKATQSRSKAYLRKPNITMAKSAAGRAITERKPVIISDVRKTPGFQYPDIAKREGLCSLIALPMFVKNEIIGALNCYTDSPREFSEDEIAVLTTLAGQAAISIQNAKLMVQAAVLQEMHHRVKNSLQTIASLLRLQLRMGKFGSPKAALKQSINRIQSIAAVHELLSSENLDDVNVKKLADSILSATVHGLIPEGCEIQVDVDGGDFMLPSGNATYVALILNELIQNALEHGLQWQAGGELTVAFAEDDEKIYMDVSNNGIPISKEFDIRQHRNLGLQIVESLVRDNLFGEFSLVTEDGLTRATVSFPK